MSLLNLFWHLNVTDNTKYLIVIGLFVTVLIACYFGGTRKKTTKKLKNKKHNIPKFDDAYVDYLTKPKLSMCEQKYMQCKESNFINDSEAFCVPCLDDGNAPNFFYDSNKKEWIKTN